MLASWIPSGIKNTVNNLPEPDGADMDDGWCWPLGKLGCYTASSAYAWLLSRNRTWLENSNWSWIWHLHALEKVRFLFWLILHNAIPINLIRFSRGLAASALCARCNLEEESILHCLRDCPVARSAWSHLPYSTNTNFFSSNVHDWVTTNSSNVLFLSGVWWM